MRNGRRPSKGDVVVLASEGPYTVSYSCPVVDIEPSRMVHGSTYELRHGVPCLLVCSVQEFPTLGCVDVLMTPTGTMVAVDHGARSIVEPL